MIDNKNISKTIKDQFAIWVMIVTGAILLIATVLILVFNGEAMDEKVYFALLPMLGTWIGTIIAFYFGKENFNAASNMFKKLTPDVLDDVKVKQIMIAFKTMVTKSFDDIKEMKISELTMFLTNIDKSRLPVLHEGRPKYIIHESLFLKAKPEVLFSTFEKEHESVIIGFIKAKEDETLESVRKRMNDKAHCEDVFIIDSNDKVTGWLTDTFILRYLNSK